MNIMLLYVRYQKDSKIINIVIIDQKLLAPITCILITAIGRFFPHKIRLISVIQYNFFYITSIKNEKVYGPYNMVYLIIPKLILDIWIRTQKRIQA